MELGHLKKESSLPAFTEASLSFCIILYPGIPYGTSKLSYVTELRALNQT